MTESSSWLLPVRGDSMCFLLKTGDLALVRRCDPALLRAGDLVVALEGLDGGTTYVGHRLLGFLPLRDGRYAVTKGDSTWIPDRLCLESGLIGRVEAIRVSGRWRALRVSPVRGWAVALAAPALYRTLRLLRAVAGERPAARLSRVLQSASVSACCDGETAVAGAATRPEVGILDVDKTWSGEVEVSGDVYVAPGVTLTVAPGAVVRFRADSRWSLPGRSGPRPSRLIVAGRLRARGARLVGEGWGGVVVTGSRETTLEDCEISGCAGAGVELSSGEASLVRSRVSGCGRGAAVDGGRLEASCCSFSSFPEEAILLRAGSATLRACAFRAVGTAVRAWGGRAELEDVRVFDSRDGAIVAERGRHRLSSVSFIRCAEPWRAAGSAEVVVEQPGRAAEPGFVPWAVSRLLWRAALAAWARAGSGLRPLYLRGRDVVGVSPALEGEEGLARVRRFWRTFERLDRFVPGAAEFLLFDASDREAARARPKRADPFVDAADAYTRAMTHPASPRARAQALRALHELASREPAPAPGAEGEAALSEELGEPARRRALRARLERELGPGLVAACCDDLYRSYLILSDEGLADAERSFEGLDRLGAARAGPPTRAIVLTASAWRAWTRRSYLECPTLALEGAREALRPAASWLPGLWLHSWGLPSGPGKLDEEALERARDAWIALRLRWRYQLSPAAPFSSAYRMHYLLSRAMGLRLLLERGLAAPLFSLDPLGRLYAREFPSEAAFVENLWRAADERAGPPITDEVYAWADGVLRRRD